MSKGLTKETDTRVKKTADKLRIPLSEICVENSTYGRGHLKFRLIENGMLRNKCYICNLDPIWNNKKLVMVLDHKNGINNDNRPDNLQLLCPNCNSQTDTFCSKNIAYQKKNGQVS